MSAADSRAPWWNRWVRVQLVGLGAATVAVAVRWAAGGLWAGWVPTGLLLTGPTGGLLLAVRRPLTVGLGLLAAGLVAVNITAPPGQLLALALTRRVAETALLLQIAGVAVAVVAGTGALLVAARQTWRTRAERTDGVRVGIREAQIVGLLLLAPICAEYLSAYDSSTGHPVALVSGLVFFVPLYGCAALLIRETARRAGLGWTGILALAAAFGVLQAGVVDQSIFSPDYRGIEGWDEAYRATVIGPLGLSAYNAFAFVGGHVVVSICAPIALIEAAVPTTSVRPWLGRVGLAVTGLLWAAGSALVLGWHLTTEDSHASAAQVTGALVVVAILVAAARAARSRRTAPASVRPAPRVAVVLGVSSVIWTALAMTSPSWLGVGAYVVAFGVAGAGLGIGSRRRGWGIRHIAAAAAAPLLVQGVLAFGYDPLVGEVAPPAKLAHNAVMLAIVAGAGLIALRGARPHRDTDSAPDVGAGRKTR